jgi:hypothetical protein
MEVDILNSVSFGILAAQPEEFSLKLVAKILSSTTNGGASSSSLYGSYLENKFFQRDKCIDDDKNSIKLPGEQV